MPNRELKIAYGNSRQAAFWSNKTVRWEDLCERLLTPVRTSETVEEYQRMPKTQRDAIKDKGGFVAGHLRNNRRKAENVQCRSMLVYDLDEITSDFDLEATIDRLGFYYTTHSHTPRQPRARLLMPLTRDLSPDEFNAVSRLYAADKGFINVLDACSFSPNQLMYWPTCPANGEYHCGELNTEWLNPDEVLRRHPDWRDCSLLPTTPRESRATQITVQHQSDPLTKEGMVGVFCRAYYPIEDAIGEFLRDVYAPAVNHPDRYDYIPGEGSAGVVIYDHKFAYSHHATDPAGNQLCNAFDLVRVHKFGDLEDAAAFSAMCEFAMQQEKVVALLAKERMEQAENEFPAEDDPDWEKFLERNGKTGDLKSNLHNITLILQHDPKLQGIMFNQLEDCIEIKGEMPWPNQGKFWRDIDDVQLVCYLDSTYGIFSVQNSYMAVNHVAEDRAYHPIKQMFEHLPPWDGIPRVDMLLVDYLGAEDNDYTHAVMRKTLCAAYTRLYHPGAKFDYAMVLNGAQGIGKSTLIAKLGMQWFSDSLSLSDMNDKTAAEKLQGYWILEIGELAGMKKADIDKVKAFISRQDDKYRASFARRVTSHPRQCVFFGTTNSEKGFLRDITGNRRFWPVKVSGESPLKPWQLTDYDVQQVWAEVREIAPDEKLYLEAELEEDARREQQEAMEQDEREGLVREYLDTLLPDGWEDMDVFQRRNYFNDPDDPTRPKGKYTRQTVCYMEIWCECFGKPKEDLHPKESYAIAAILKHLEDWENTNDRVRFKPYGRQRVWQRVR